MTHTDHRLINGRHARRGTILVAVVIALVVLQLLVVTITLAGARDQDLSVRRVEAVRSFYAAESCANMAIREFVTNTDDDTNGTVGGIASSSVPTSVGGGSVWATVSSNVSGNTTTATLTMNSTSGTAARELVTSLTRTASSTGVPGFYTEVWESASTYANINAVGWSSAPKWIGVVPQAYYTSINDRARWPGHQPTRFAQRWSGAFTVPAGTHGFQVSSDDGFDLRLNGTSTILFSTPRGCGATSGSLLMTASTPTLELRYFENTGGQCLTPQWRPNNTGGWVMFDDSNVTCTPTVTVAPIAVAGSVALSGDGTAASAFIDAFNSNSGVYGGSNILTNQTVLSTNATANMSVTLASNASIKGSVQTGPSSQPNAVKAYTPSTVTGTTSSMTYSVAIPEYAHPATQPATSGSFNNSGTITLSSNTRYTAFQLNGASSTLTINGDIYLFCDGNFSLSSGARVIVSSGSRLTLVVGGNVNIWTGSSLNMSPGLPSQCRLFINATNVARTINLTDSSTAAANIWATWCTMNINNTAQFYGTFRGNALNMTDTAQFHADIATTIGGSGATTTKLQSWAQVSP